MGNALPIYLAALKTSDNFQEIQGQQTSGMDALMLTPRF